MTTLHELNLRNVTCVLRPEDFSDAILTVQAKMLLDDINSVLISDVTETIKDIIAREKV